MVRRGMPYQDASVPALDEEVMQLFVLIRLNVPLGLKHPSLSHEFGTDATRIALVDLPNWKMLVPSNIFSEFQNIGDRTQKDTCISRKVDILDIYAS